MLYGASAIGRGAENAAGEISARDTNGSIACIGNYSNSTGCSSAIEFASVFPLHRLSS